MGNHRASGQNIRYCGVNCALGPSKSIRYSGDFVIAGFVFTYFIVILPGFQMLFLITGSSNCATLTGVRGVVAVISI